MIVVRAPLRISLGGGGTDLAAYYERFGGFVLSTSITRYAYVVVRRPVAGGLHLNSADYRVSQSFHSGLPPVDEPLILPKAILEWFARGGKLHDGVEVFLASEVAPGTGLGSSSSISVALLQALAAYTGESYSATELAELAAWIEIERLGMPIGKQDQYAAAVGGLNTISFSASGVKIAPLLLPEHLRRALDMRLMLFSTDQSRHAGDILKDTVRNLSSNGHKNGSSHRLRASEPLHHLKALAGEMCDALKLGDLDAFGALLDESWRYKQQLSAQVSTPQINHWYQAARAAGAIGGKISGAGGGGYMLLYCPPRHQRAVRTRLKAMGLQELSFGLDTAGVTMSPLQPSSPPIYPAPALEEKRKPMSTNDLQMYWQDLGAMLQQMPLRNVERAVDLLADCQHTGGTVFTVGNGGSAATASHFACDLAKGTRSNGAPTFRAISLSDNISLLTAWGNDASYEQVFAEQLGSLIREGDVLVAISTSGNSPNVVAAAAVARARDARVIALTGPHESQLRRLADLTIAVPPGSIEQIEDLHMAVSHSLTVALRNRLAVAASSQPAASGPRQATGNVLRAAHSRIPTPRPAASRTETDHGRA